jgi:hypothetical protein
MREYEFGFSFFRRSGIGNKACDSCARSCFYTYRYRAIDVNVVFVRDIASCSTDSIYACIVPVIAAFVNVCIELRCRLCSLNCSSRHP